MSDHGETRPVADGGTEEPTVPIRCAACDTTTRVPLSSLAEAIERHNETRHDGEDLAEVDPGVADRLADLVARDMGLLEEE